MTAVTEDSRQRQERLDQVGQAAERWKAHHAAEFSALAHGTTVIINVQTGEYVAAENWQEAWSEFDQSYGFSTPSFMFTVGKPIIVGGGLWLKSWDR